MGSAQHYWTPRAWVAGAWAEGVLLSAGGDGRWQSIKTGVAAAPAGTATRLGGPVIPGIVNAHSHAFQRAIAGLTERSAGHHDDFWSWRERMYRVALRITPAQLEAIATQLYAELLQGGYTHVCEFHYLHNDLDGRPYANPLEMSLALVRAAAATGIGLTLLPVLYMHSGFGAQAGTGGLREDQRRFASTPDSVLRIAQAVNQLDLPKVCAGLALHSLRAVDPAALRETTQAAALHGWPIHIHIAEQMQEVDDCITHHGQRPVAWLLDHAAVDPRWNLVHATHTTAQELAGIQSAGAAVVLCPSTEANLGDGVFDLPAYLKLQGAWSVGSDSQVTRRFDEELRLLEYAQRLARRQRNLAARASGLDSSAAALMEGALRGGSAAAGTALAGLAVGQRADFCVLDAEAPALAGIPHDHLLDALIFSSPGAGFRAVHVAGNAVQTPPASWQAGLVRAMRSLWD